MHLSFIPVGHHAMRDFTDSKYVYMYMCMRLMHQTPF